jgi:hypothetical protein
LETGRSHRVPSQGSTVGGGWQPFCISPETAGWGQKCEMGRCHGEAARSVLAKVRGDVFTRFHAVAAQRRSRTRNSVWPVETGASRYHNCCIDGGTSLDYFGYHLVHSLPFHKKTQIRLYPNGRTYAYFKLKEWGVGRWRLPLSYSHF